MKNYANSQPFERSKQKYLKFAAKKKQNIFQRLKILYKIDLCTTTTDGGTKPKKNSKLKSNTF